MGVTYTAIASSTVGSGGASSITFSSIPQTYTDLFLSYSLRTGNSNNAQGIKINFNNTTGNWSHRYLLGDGVNVSSGTNAYSFSPDYGWAGYSVAATATANTFSNGTIYIPNYTGSTNKSISVDCVNENDATDSVQVLIAALWSSTAAITSFTLTPFSSTFNQYSTATLYGIKNS